LENRIFTIFKNTTSIFEEAEKMILSTIAALATPGGKGGIGIIKVSGESAVSIASRIFRKAGREETGDPNRFESHKLYYGHILDPNSDGVIDEVLLSVMKTPNSYTREDVVEINAHSGPAVLSRILNIVLESGAELAEPGEFTKRAFLNGRIDLTQAEGIIDTINAQTHRSLEIASSQITGEFRIKVETIRNKLFDILIEAEAAIDFPDDVNDVFIPSTVIDFLNEEILPPIGSMLKQYQSGHVFREGIKMAVVGKPNVGKSSLMNVLVQKDRVIVTSLPGTTRDLIEDTLDIHGIPITVTDTAGLHHTDDPIEVIGIQKTREYLETADLVLFLIDGSEPLTNPDFKIFDTIQDRRSILVINKVDLMNEGVEYDVPSSWTMPSIMMSALYGTGVQSLKDLIARETVGNGLADHGSYIVPNLRHKLALEESLKAVNSAVKGLKDKVPVEIIAIDLNEAVDKLGEIVGANASEDLLEQIFNRFCIGK